MAFTDDRDNSSSKVGRDFASTLNITKPTTLGIQDWMGHTILCHSAYSIWNFHALRATNQQRKSLHR